MMPQKWAAIRRALEEQRDEARAIAQQLADALDNLLARSRHDEIEILGSFHALPWAKGRTG